jgi:hypothetical protein
VLCFGCVIWLFFGVFCGFLGFFVVLRGICHRVGMLMFWVVCWIGVNNVYYGCLGLVCVLWWLCWRSLW